MGNMIIVWSYIVFINGMEMCECSPTGVFLTCSVASALCCLWVWAAAGVGTLPVFECKYNFCCKWVEAPPAALCSLSDNSQFSNRSLNRATEDYLLRTIWLCFIDPPCTVVVRWRQSPQLLLSLSLSLYTYSLLCSLSLSLLCVTYLLFLSVD